MRRSVRKMKTAPMNALIKKDIMIQLFDDEIYDYNGTIIMMKILTHFDGNNDGDDDGGACGLY